ncbi:MAG: DUF3187 family protein [Proteobacteria bacterium]|nr:DUF3187 family protein [Pseudomonadota bacterium]
MSNRHLSKPLIGLGFACIGFSHIAGAGDFGEPLYVKNLSPVAGLLGLPSQRQANTQAPGSYSVALHSSIASHYVAETTSTEQLNLDGETVRFALEVRYGLAENWDLQLEVPWLKHSGGNLDSAIDNWHDLWGMSDSGRSRVEHDILDFHYYDPADRFLLEDDASGIGDISLSLSHAFFRDDNSVLSVVTGYKFATGGEDELLGSGEDDFFLALRFSGAHLGNLPLSWHGQLGYLYAGSSDVLGARQENNLWFGGLSMDWAVAQRFSLFAQLDMHAAPLNSELTALGDEAILGSLGGRWRFAENWALDFSFIEDLQVETGPDITFQASVRYGGGNQRIK